MDVKTKGQSMTLSYWRGEADRWAKMCDEAEEINDGLVNDLFEARRKTKNAISRENYWKKRVASLAAEKKRRIEERNLLLRIQTDTERALLRETSLATEYFKKNTSSTEQIKHLKERLSLEVVDKNWWKDRAISRKQECEDIRSYLTISYIALVVSLAVIIFLI